MRGETDITVVIPAYNAEATIGEALESVLGQEGVTVEALVIDDGSTDGTAAVVVRAVENSGTGRIRLIRHPGGGNRGVAASRNLGVQGAQGALVGFLDADDCLLPGALAAGFEVFRSFPDVVLVYGRVQRTEAVQGRGAFVGSGVPGQPFSLAQWLLFENPLPTSGTMARRVAMLQCAFPEGLQHQVEDWAAWLALSRLGRAFFLDRELACYRRSAASWSVRLADRWIRHAQLIEEAGLLRSFHLREPDVPACDVNEALAYRSGALLVETVGQLVRLRLGTARRCLASALAVAGSPAVLVRGVVCWAPRIKARSWFPSRRPTGPAWRRFTSS